MKADEYVAALVIMPDGTLTSARDIVAVRAIAELAARFGWSQKLFSTVASAYTNAIDHEEHERKTQ